MSNGKAHNDDEQLPAGTCGQETEVYSRVTGYYRPVTRWNKGKQEEFKDRKTFEIARDNYVLSNVNKHYDPQMGVEYTTADIVTGGAK